MNSILNRGFVSPYIEFNFAAGSIDTIPPKYFMNFHQKRTVKEACEFTLEIMYAPNVYTATDSLLIHKLLLASVNKPVTYKYGYIGHGTQVPVTQDQAYCGIFLEYDETLNGGYITYKISGVAYQITKLEKHLQIQTFLKYFRAFGSGFTGNGVGDGNGIQPSRVVEALLFGDYTNYVYEGIPLDNSEARELFRGYEPIIQHTDDYIKPSELNVPDGTIHDILMGKYDKNGSYLPGRFVKLSNRTYNYDTYSAFGGDLISNGVMTQEQFNLLQGRDYLVNHGLSSSVTYAMDLAYQELQRVKVMPYVCFFDNVISDTGSSNKGKFYYIEKYNRQPTNIFTYNFGNNFIDSDVLNFDVTIDCTPALGTVSSLEEVTGNIDVAGNFIGSNNSVTQTGDFVRNSYNTLSGFNESSFITSSMMTEALNFPFNATMTIIGQTECNHLMDTIRVNVYVNGVQHEGLTGDYTIFEIEDNLSSSGFTTTFTLTKFQTPTEEPAQSPQIVSNGEDSNAMQTQNILDENS